MRFILDAVGLGGGGDYTGVPFEAPSKGVYQPPSGAIIPFDFEDIDSTIETKTAIFETAAGSGTYVQQNGITSGRFPLRIFFHGQGYAEKAEGFLSALLEPGVGSLLHPTYSKAINVVPVGEIRRTDPYRSGAGQVIFEVTFYETTGLQIGADTGLPQLYEALLDASAVDFSDKAALSNAADRKSFVKTVKKVAKSIEKGLKTASKGLAGATGLIEDVGDSIDRGVDLLVGQPLALARQTQILIGEPRRQAVGTRAKLDGYKNLAENIFTGIAAEPSKYSNDALNSFLYNKFAAQMIVANYAMLSVEGSGEYLTRGEYLNVADLLAALRDSYQTWYDDQYDAIEPSIITNSELDTGEGQDYLRQIVSGAISDLVTKSFEAKTQMVAALDNERTPLDLCYELYGTTEFDTLDFFYRSNNFGGDEYFLIPKGREIVWYV